MFFLGGGGSSLVDGSKKLSRSSILARYGHSPPRCSTSSFPKIAAFVAFASKTSPESQSAAACLNEPKPFLAEHFCVDCRTPFLNASPLDENGRCGLCRAGLSGYDAVYAYGEYEGNLRKLIHVFKYGGVTPLASEARTHAQWSFAARRTIRRDCSDAFALAEAVATGF